MKWQRGQLPPGPPGLPFVGNTVRYVRRDPFEFLPRVTRQYGPVVRWRLLGTTFYQVNTPDAIEHVLVENNQNYAKGDVFQRALAVTGDGLLNAEGDHWRRQRHLIQPAFDPNNVVDYAPTVTALTEQMLDSWADGERVSVYDEMRSLTLDVVSRSLLGVDIRRDIDTIGEALDEIMARSESFLAAYLPPWTPIPVNRRFERAVASLDELVYDIISNRRSGLDDDIVSTLRTARDEKGREMSLEQLRDEVMTLLLAGHETTSLALTYSLLSIATHPDVEEKLLAEFGDVVDERTPTAEDTRHLPYTSRVFREALRMYPPVYAIVREAIAPDELSGYHVPAGTTVVMYQWLVHRDPRFYENPMAFRPERWTDDFEKQLPRFAYFPFGGGPRRCVGSHFAQLEALLVLVTLLQRYHLELVSSPSPPLTAALTMRPKTPVEAVVHTR